MIGKLSISHLWMSEAFRGFNVSSKDKNIFPNILKNVTQTCLLTVFGVKNKKCRQCYKKIQILLFFVKKIIFWTAENSVLLCFWTFFLPFFAIITS